MRYDDEEEGVSILSPGPVRPSAIAGIVGLLADYWQTRRPRPALRSSALDGGHEHAASSSKRLASSYSSLRYTMQQSVSTRPQLRPQLRPVRSEWAALPPLP
jgi:hypothetical protein